MSSRSSNGIPTDREVMKYLVGYVTGKPFPLKHTVMDVNDRYGIRAFTPSQIFESTMEPAKKKKKNTRYLITFQDLTMAKEFAGKAAPGIWKCTSKTKSIVDANKRHMGNIKISRYYYYGKDKSSPMRKSKWHMREYYLASKYLPPNKVERKNVLITMINKEEQKGRNTDNNQVGKLKSDDGEMMEGQNDVVSSQIMQSLQALQLQPSSY